MKTIAKPIAILSLVATLGAPLLTACGKLGDGPMKVILLVTTITWFLFSPYWLEGGKE